MKYSTAGIHNKTKILFFVDTNIIKQNLLNYLSTSFIKLLGIRYIYIYIYIYIYTFFSWHDLSTNALIYDFKWLGETGVALAIGHGLPFQLESLYP